MRRAKAPDKSGSVMHHQTQQSGGLGQRIEFKAGLGYTVRPGWLDQARNLGPWNCLR